MVHVETTDRASGPIFKELMRVRTLRALQQGGDAVPKGAVGTIVHVYPGDVAFEVEFTSPISAVITSRRDDLGPE